MVALIGLAMIQLLLNLYFYVRWRDAEKWQAIATEYAGACLQRERDAKERLESQNGAISKAFEKGMKRGREIARKPPRKKGEPRV